MGTNMLAVAVPKSAIDTRVKIDPACVFVGNDDHVFAAVLSGETQAAPP